jgi:hypothetical protein
MSDMPRDCPFCGAQPEITKHFKEEMWSLMHKCPKVGVIYMDWTARKDRHIAAWNTRASELAKAYEAIVELADAVEHYNLRNFLLQTHSDIIKTAREQGK